MPLKLAVSGKGGVGKTTISAVLANLFGRDGRRVVLVDADPSPNLAAAVGIEEERHGNIVPLSNMLDLIEERTGVRPGESYGRMFRLNPEVADILDKYGVNCGGNVVLLTLGTIESGGSGCFCPESALLKSLMRHLIFERDELVIMDMEAGVEHLGRRTAEGVDTLLIVVEPGMRSVEAARRIRGLAVDIGIKKIFCVLNNYKDESEANTIESELNELDLPLLGKLPYDRELEKADLKGEGVEAVINSPEDTGFIEGMMELKKRIQGI